MFTSFFVKKSASPSPSDAGPCAFDHYLCSTQCFCPLTPPLLLTRRTANSSPAPATSDFDRVFHPFTIRERVEVAPPNRFFKSGRSYDIEIDSKPDLTLAGQSGVFSVLWAREPTQNANASQPRSTCRLSCVVPLDGIETPHPALQSVPVPADQRSSDRQRHQRREPDLARREQLVRRAQGPEKGQGQAFQVQGGSPAWLCR